MTKLANTMAPIISTMTLEERIYDLLSPYRNLLALKSRAKVEKNADDAAFVIVTRECPRDARETRAYITKATSPKWLVSNSAMPPPTS
jgi:hypothetical protein